MPKQTLFLKDMMKKLQRNFKTHKKKVSKLQTKKVSLNILLVLTQIKKKNLMISQMFVNLAQTTTTTTIIYQSQKLKNTLTRNAIYKQIFLIILMIHKMLKKSTKHYLKSLITKIFSKTKSNYPISFN